MPEESSLRNEHSSSKLVRLLLGSPTRRFLTIFVLGYFLVGAITLPDYGMTWDESWENHYGDKTLNYFFSFDPDHLDFDKESVKVYSHPLHPDFHFAVNLYRDNDLVTQPHLVWPVAPVISSACKYAFFDFIPIMTVVDAHHVAPVMGGLFLGVGLFLFLRKRLGFTVAAVAAVALSLYPRWWAHCHFNPKDVLSTVFFSFTVFTFVTAMERRTIRSYAASAILCGLAVACKANAFFIPFVVMPFFVGQLFERRRQGVRVITRNEILCWLAYPALTLATAFACWPLMWMNFPTNILKYWESLVNRGYTGEAAWNVIPLKYAFATMPLAMIALFILGLAVMVAARTRFAPTSLLLYAWISVPILRVCVPGALDFDGIRHWLEFLPPAAAVMGIGVAWGMNRLDRVLKRGVMVARNRQLIAVALVVLCFVPQVTWMIRNHPHQLTFFNPIVGRLSGARARGYPDATDYWGSSYRQGVDWLNARADEKPFVTLEVAEHLAFYYFDCIIEEGITVRPKALMEQTMTANPNRPYYMMTIVRPSWQKGITKQYHDRPIVYRITVDGADILRIRRIDERVGL